MDFKCIRIYDDYFEVLDQLKLPEIIEYIKIDNLEMTWSVIHKMNVRGAPLIAVVGVQGIYYFLKNFGKNEKLTINKLDESINYILTSRPTAVNLFNDLMGLRKVFETKELSIEEVKSYVDQNLKGYEDANDKLSENGRDIIFSNEKLFKIEKLNVLTICNTGKLATPGIGTALGIVRKLHEAKRLNNLYVPETRPYNQGSRLTAFECISDNIPATLIADNMVGILMQKGLIDLVIVGADRITKSGYTANKIGTYSFACLANNHNIPFYVAAPFSTINQIENDKIHINEGDSITIEERPDNELKYFNNKLICPDKIKVFNPAFDVTPPNLITSIITEKGDYKSMMWKKLSEQEINNYIEKISDEKVTEFRDVADGNLNYVYQVKTNLNEYCVKQAPPWVKCVGESWSLSVDRIFYESEGLKYFNKLNPNLTPKFIHFNKNCSLLIMEFLKDHIILRRALINKEISFDFGITIGEFSANSSFYSSELFLNPSEYRNFQLKWNNDSLCQLTEQVIFTDPYIDSELNRMTSGLEDIKEKLKSDKSIKSAVFELKRKFVCLRQALIHGDLHTGSVMINESLKSVKIIDTEFCFYGPIGFDNGLFLANLIFSLCYFSSNEHEQYSNYIMKQIQDFLNSFENNFNNLFNSKKCKEYLFIDDISDYLSDILQDTIGFAGCEVIRRIVGVAHVEEFESIKDIELKLKLEKLALKYGITLLNSFKTIKTVKEFISLLQNIKVDKI